MKLHQAIQGCPSTIALIFIVGVKIYIALQPQILGHFDGHPIIRAES